MSAHMKKLRTNSKQKRKIQSLRIEFSGEQHTFTNVPLTSIKKFIHSILEFSNNDSVDFETAYKDHFKTIGGISAYRLSAHAVKTCRIDYKLTQKKLAELLATDQAHISNIEHARKPVGKVLAKRLASIFKEHNASFFLSDLPD